MRQERRKEEAYCVQPTDSQDLVVHPLTNKVLAAVQCDIDMSLQKIAQVFTFLSPGRRKIVFYLLKFLKHVSNFSDVNKMTVTNLAIVFSPSILRADMEDDSLQILEDYSFSNKLLELCVTNYERLESEIDKLTKTNTSLKEQEKHKSEALATARQSLMLSNIPCSSSHRPRPKGIAPHTFSHYEENELSNNFPARPALPRSYTYDSAAISRKPGSYLSAKAKAASVPSAKAKAKPKPKGKALPKAKPNSPSQMSAPALKPLSPPGRPPLAPSGVPSSGQRLPKAKCQGGSRRAGSHITPIISTPPSPPASSDEGDFAGNIGSAKRKPTASTSRKAVSPPVNRRLPSAPTGTRTRSQTYTTTGASKPPPPSPLRKTDTDHTIGNKSPGSTRSSASSSLIRPPHGATFIKKVNKKSEEKASLLNDYA